MSDPIDDYRAAMRAELPRMQGAGNVLAELEDHLREAAEQRVRSGVAPQDAAQQAVDRFGSVELIGRRLRAQHGPPLLDDPAPVRGWPFTVAEILLLLAALSVGAATYAHWLPCGGDAITASSISNACLTRMDAAWAFPFAPEAGKRDLVADGFRLTALLLLAAAWTLFSFAQPWRPRIRLCAALPAVALVIMAFDTAWLMRDPAAEPHWWAETAGYAVDGLALVAFAAVTLALLRTPSGKDGRGAPPSTMTYWTFRRRTILLLLGVTTAGFLRVFLEFSIMIGISKLNWDSPPGSGYLAAGFIAAMALGSLLLGRFAARPRDVRAEPIVLVPVGDNATSSG